MLIKFILIIKLIFTPFVKLTLPQNLKIFAIDNNDEKLKIAQQYIRKQIIYTHSLHKIKWNHILRRKIRLVSIPRSKKQNHFDKYKWIAIRYLNLTISDELKILNLHNILYNDTAKFNIITASSHACNIYKANLPKFNTIHSFDHFSFIFCLSTLFSSLTIYFSRKQKTENGITVFTNPKSYLLLNSYYRIHPNKDIIVRFHDVLSINDKKLIKKIKQKLPQIVIESYSKIDSRQNSIKYRPNGVSPEFINQFDCPYRDFLYKFDGAKSDLNNKIRTEPLDLINKEIFTIYKEIRAWISAKTNDSLENYLPYNEYCRISATAEIVIDLSRVNLTEGFSFRIPEALFLNRKIITDRIILMNEPFYSTDRVFIIGHDPLSRLKEFLEKDIPALSSNILKYYDSSLWWTKFDPY